MAGKQVETVWYRNTEFDTLHEVVKGTDTEKRLRREQRQVGDDENDVVAAYESAKPPRAAKRAEAEPASETAPAPETEK